MKRNYHGQMSDSFILGILLSLSGGFQDAYSYVCRGSVFANAQTGNIVLLGKYAAERNLERVFHYAVPLLAFVGGIFLAQKVQQHFKKCENIHWRQIVLLFEILILFLAGCLPVGGGMDIAANALVSFACAMQVDTFRKIRGNAVATTMCIGNLRNATALLCSYEATGDPKLKWKSMQYYSLILVFAVGAVLGNEAVARIQGRAIWFCCILLLLGFFVMLIRDEEEELVSGKDTETIGDEIRDIGRALKEELKIGGKENESDGK